MNRLTNAMISAASARVRDTRIDVRVGGSRGPLEKRHGGHDHPGLTVTALRHVKLLPCKLHRVRTIDGQAFNRGDPWRRLHLSPEWSTNERLGRSRAPCTPRTGRSRNRTSFP